MITVCEVNKCTGCMACVDICPQNAIDVKENIECYQAQIDTTKCINCNLCKKVCQVQNSVKKITPQKWNQGWAADESIRSSSASGGLASAISNSFVQKGGTVCTCAFENGGFGFRLFDDVESLKEARGSKYVKSNPKGIYAPAKKVLAEGKKLLFIGLPCQVAGIKNYVGEKLCENLYTIDLICHGSPSPKVLETFLAQYGCSLDTINSISFRKGDQFKLSSTSDGFPEFLSRDEYTISFLNSISYTENCYACEYASAERISDLTLGDSWGSDLPPDEMKKGISLVLCQTEKGIELMNDVDLTLFDVDVKKAIENNRQLISPSKRPKKRKTFLSEISKGKKFNKVVFKCYSKQVLKQKIKSGLIKNSIIK